MDFSTALGAVTAKYPRFIIPVLKLEQREAIAFLLGGHNVLGILPTGFGKSLIMYLLPFCKMRALMKHQCATLKKQGIPCACILPMEEMSEEEKRDILNGHLKVVWSSPEALLDASLSWRRLCTTLSARVSLLAFDKAHCITHWGEEFRPDFARVGELRSLVCPSTRTLILTATMSADMRDRVFSLLHLPGKQVKIITKQPDRPNIFLSLVPDVRREDMPEWLHDHAALITAKGSETPKAIIYCRTIPMTVQVWGFLMETLGNSAFRGGARSQANQLVAMFHSRISVGTEERLIRGFSDGSIRCMVATIAFGLGIDVPDVRHVFLFGMPSNAVDTWQMIGRAGRDGALADACICPRYQGQVEASFKDLLSRCKSGEERCLRRALIRSVSVDKSGDSTSERCCSVSESHK
ncbi:hypothetical protein CAPTEDRAFT_186662 [Capitella teleta]|uniref:DNA 3'-5' helicase n=1 Tax=Capitella teleta TaxID=283909 RepID=R7TPY4_CAPTE|nr:hypothetical protein CAPTEDRAFT_186662 [Capitella teleta]|eukprot:ELT95943.1 hypothetical protein CAPTEDRAFT_186662 [Capitella teleta]